MANSVKVANKNKKLNISGYSVLKLQILSSTSYLRGLAISLFICVCCRFLYGLGQGLGAGSGIRGWVRVRSLNTYICGDGKRQGLWLQLSFSQLNTLG